MLAQLKKESANTGISDTWLLYHKKITKLSGQIKPN